jgi:hypothetical protein
VIKLLGHMHLRRNSAEVINLPTVIGRTIWNKKVYNSWQRSALFCFACWMPWYSAASNNLTRALQDVHDLHYQFHLTTSSLLRMWRRTGAVLVTSLLKSEKYTWWGEEEKEMDIYKRMTTHTWKKKISWEMCYVFRVSCILLHWYCRTPKEVQRRRRINKLIYVEIRKYTGKIKKCTIDFLLATIFYKLSGLPSNHETFRRKKRIHVHHLRSRNPLFALHKHTSAKSKVNVPVLKSEQ